MADDGLSALATLFEADFAVDFFLILPLASACHGPGNNLGPGLAEAGGRFTKRSKAISLPQMYNEIVSG